MSQVVEEKSMVPTVIVGVGGTGAEVLSRIRRLIEESYGSLRKFPIVGFLWIDTDQGYKVTDPQAAGSPLQDHEKHWASVSGNEVRNIMSNMERFPWIESWFPQELERNISALEAGAGQIRACGRFAFFYNYAKIQDRFNEACSRVKGHESEMREQYGIRVSGNALNVFVVGSLSGGTGSGMLTDLAYCIRSWLRGQGSPMITAIVPMPNAFAGVKVAERVLANGYAALMELNYFSDHRTEYVAQFGRDLATEVRDKRAPFDFTYLVGSKNGEKEFSLDELRELIAQNIFLDLTSDFAPHKRSIRDNIKGAWAQADPGGRGYPKSFMSFGLATMEVPVVQIRTTLSNRLAKNLVQWWLNESALLPPNMVDLVQTFLSGSAFPKVNYWQTLPLEAANL
jgi:Tubulin like